MALFPRPAILDPDPLPRLQRQIADQRHRQVLAIRTHDKAVQADAERRLDGLLDSLCSLLAARQNAGK
jgi:hypothetical protein